jgi:TonB family protein
MAVKDYKTLVVQWHPNGGKDRSYRFILALCLVIAVLLAVVLTLVPVPEAERPSRDDIPDRVARFITERPEPPAAPEPEPRPEPRPVPQIEHRPVVQRERPREIEEPLTEQEQQARERAEQSGLLALGHQLADMMDTSDVDAMVNTRATDRPGDGAGETLAGFTDADTPTAAARAGTVSAGDYAASVGTSSLSRRELAVLTEEPVIAAPGGGTDAEVTRSFANTGRSEEEVTLVFDQYKGTLYSLYNRARRQTPGLRGRLVLELTIAPSGDVTEVRIVSSELNNASLEQRIKARVKQFQFEQKDAEPITIIFPIEFLPS